MDDFWKRQVERWRTLPCGGKRIDSAAMLEWPDDQLYTTWMLAQEKAWAASIWYLEAYKETVKGKHILDVGPGLALDSLYWARLGLCESIAFADIVPENLALLDRLCGLLDVEAKFFYHIDDPTKIELPDTHDALVSIGCLHHVPFGDMKVELAGITRHMEYGGKALIVVYPWERYGRSGARDFMEFAEATDGPGTPWAEPYGDAKIEVLFGPEFRLDNAVLFNKDRFVFFELTKVGDE